MKNVNKAFLEYHDANDLGKLNAQDLADIRAAFVAGFNCNAGLIAEMMDLVDSLEAPSLGDLRPNEDLVHDYYQRIIYMLAGYKTK